MVEGCEEGLRAGKAAPARTAGLGKGRSHGEETQLKTKEEAQEVPAACQSTFQHLSSPILHEPLRSLLGMGWDWANY